MTTENKPADDNLETSNPAPVESDKKNRQIANYILEQKLGQGGMAEVWKARHQVLGTYVAIKFLSPGFAGVPDIESRFLSEGKKQARLFHPNIVTAYDFVYLDGCSYLIMKFVEGESLDELLFRLQAPMPLPQVLAIATDVLHALGYAHAQGVVHRDIKPSNILVETGGRALVMDFGIALIVGERRATSVGTAVGTPDYMSPEQIMGSPDIDNRSDIYSFGCVLYQMLTGKAPFETGETESDTAFAIQERHMRQPPVPPRQWNPYIPEYIERAVLHCLEKNAADRFASCQDLLTALNSGTPTPLPHPEADTAIRPIYPRKDTLLETAAPKRSDTVVETATVKPQPEVVAEPSKTSTTSASEAVINSNLAAPPPQDLSILWIVCTAILSALLVGGFYFYTHLVKPGPAPIVNPNPAPRPGPVTPKPSPTPPIDVPKPDDNPQPPITKPDEPPVRPAPDKPVDREPAHPAPDTPPPVTKPDANPVPPVEKPKPVIPTPVDTQPPDNPVPKISTPQWHGPSEGNLVWSGQVDKNQIIQISGGAANIGTIAGDRFPGGGVPIQVSLNSNNFAVISQPNPLNQFSQISLRSTMKANIVVVIHWKVLSSD